MTTIRECQSALENGTSSVELTQAYLTGIRSLNGSLNAYLTICQESAMAQAEAADRRRKENKNVTPLTGVPIAIKDNMVIEGVRTTAASKMLADYVSPYTATVVKKLTEAGAVILGKLNMDEFAMGSSSENSAFGAVKNPWNLHCTPGGSSGGSASAVAANICVASLGSDTGGSIRQPASLTGTVGLKPTYGRVSRNGLIAFASSLDQIGPFTQTVEDAALMLEAIAGHDVGDSTSVDTPVPHYAASLTGDIRGLKIGFPKEYFIPGMDPQIVASLTEARRHFESLGAICIDISLPHSRYAIPCYYIVAPAEASSNLARYDGVRFGYRSSDANTLRDMYEHTRTEGFGDEVKLRIMIGTYVLSSGYYDAYYRKAQAARTLIRRDFEKAYATVDVIVTPTSPTAAFHLQEKTDDPIKMYLSDVFTVPANLAGIPGISLRSGFTADGLPIGMQILGKWFDESTMLKAAHAYETTTSWNKQRPGTYHSL